MQKVVEQKRIELKLKGDLSYVEGWKKTNGNMPSNVHLDEILNNPQYSNQLQELLDKEELLDKGFFAARAKEIAVYPKSGGKFEKGEGIVDSYKDDDNRQFVFPAKYIPEEVFGKKNIGLFVVPKELEFDGKKIIPIPESITILNDFLQKDGWGKMDEKTRMPIEVSQDELRALSEDQKRYFWRIGEAAVRPLVRDYRYYARWRRGVYADNRPDDAFGVAQVGTAGMASPLAELQVLFKETRRTFNEKMDELEDRFKALQIKE